MLDLTDDIRIGLHNLADEVELGNTTACKLGFMAAFAILGTAAGPEGTVAGLIVGKIVGDAICGRELQPMLHHALSQVNVLGGTSDVDIDSSKPHEIVSELRRLANHIHVFRSSTDYANDET